MLKGAMFYTPTPRVMEFLIQRDEGMSEVCNDMMQGLSYMYVCTTASARVRMCAIHIESLAKYVNWMVFNGAEMINFNKWHNCFSTTC